MACSAFTYQLIEDGRKFGVQIFCPIEDSFDLGIFAYETQELISIIHRIIHQMLHSCDLHCPLPRYIPPGCPGVPLFLHTVRP